MLLLTLCLLSGAVTVLILCAEALSATSDRRMPRPPWRT
jgi:hypothetical protein